jgi:hypothetical protein
MGDIKDLFAPDSREAFRMEPWDEAMEQDALQRQKMRDDIERGTPQIEVAHVYTCTNCGATYEATQCSGWLRDPEEDPNECPKCVCFECEEPIKKGEPHLCPAQE